PDKHVPLALPARFDHRKQNRVSGKKSPEIVAYTEHVSLLPLPCRERVGVRVEACGSKDRLLPNNSRSNIDPTTLCDRLQHLLQRLMHLIIVKPRHAMPSTLRPFSSYLVVGLAADMRFTVELQNNLCGCAIEIGDVVSDRLLPPEFQAAKPAVS